MSAVAVWGETMSETSRWAVITPSYSLDFERCQLLCRSMDVFLQGPWHHYIIVDPVDVKQFSPLAGPQRSIINKADILPGGMRYLGKVPFMRLGRLWWSPRHGPVFGWQMQQFVKILMASHVQENAMAVLDSDIFFLRPFHISKLLRGGKVRFGTIEGQVNPKDKMVNASIDLLGVNRADIRRVVLSDPIATWHRPTVIAMQNHLTALHGKPWHEAIGSRLMFSENQLYAFFVNYIQKDMTNLYADDTVYCKVLWNKRDVVGTDLAKFCADLSPPQVAVCIQSLIGLNMDLIRLQFERALAM